MKKLSNTNIWRSLKKKMRKELARYSQRNYVEEKHMVMSNFISIQNFANMPLGISRKIR
jgi:hypothetical protein